MTQIKLCGLFRPKDIATANALAPDYIGFVFAAKSPRCVTPEKARELKRLLSPRIKAVGVFVNAPVEQVAQLLREGIIDMAQLHGSEDEAYIKALRKLAARPLIKACRISGATDIAAAEKSSADHVLLDSGAGSGEVFDWELLRQLNRPYFLAGGLEPTNVRAAIKKLRPYAVDVSSGIETNGQKDKSKMAAFVAAVREEDEL